MWAPGNPLARADGVVEDVEQFRTYLRAALGVDYDAARVNAFLATAPEMVGFFHEHTALTFMPGATICDVYGDLPGAGTGHRSVAPAPVDGRELGPEVMAKLRRQLYETSFLGMGIMAGPDLTAFLSASAATPRACCTRPAASPARLRPGHPAPRHAAGQRHRAGGPVAALGARPRRRRARQLPVTELLREDGRVTGVVATAQDGPLRITAARGVVLASGRVPARRRSPPRALPRTPTGAEHWSLAPATATAPGRRWASPPVAGCARTWRRPPPGAVSLVPIGQACPIVGVVRACSRTSWTAPSPAASACSPPAAAS
jgi:succinate dehydrogenase/fumarate reductase flavoprotein subunit